MLSRTPRQLERSSSSSPAIVYPRTVLKLPTSTAKLALHRAKETPGGGTTGRLLENCTEHSRPATCVVEADIDAEDQPERDPQKGQ